MVSVPYRRHALRTAIPPLAQLVRLLWCCLGKETSRQPRNGQNKYPVPATATELVNALTTNFCDKLEEPPKVLAEAEVPREADTLSIAQVQSSTQ